MCNCCLFNLCTIVHIYVQRKDSLNNLLFEESFTRYKTYVIIARVKTLEVKWYVKVIKITLNLV